ncbi:MAG: hypothetical protein SFU84_15120 [Gemmatimonadales bacterium]|nr:hypothetical protein [Gemmatimonadales bacterium]
MARDPSHDLEQLRRSVDRLRNMVVGLSIALVSLLVSGMRHDSAEVIRTRGIIIEDAVGRERILIGAPIPIVPHRVRTDTAKVRRAWGAQMGGDRFMGYYREYRHAVHGMLVLDENGFDRLAIGDSTPDPNVGRRLGPGTGMQINDARGFERSGYSLLSVDGRYRVVLGLDGANGREGIGLSLFDGGDAGFWAYGSAGESYFAGRTLQDGGATEGGGSLLGWRLLRGDSVAASSVIGIRR